MHEIDVSLKTYESYANHELLICERGTSEQFAG